MGVKKLPIKNTRILKAILKEIYGRLSMLGWAEMGCSVYAERQGWDLFNADGYLSIQKIDDPENVGEELGAKIPTLSSDLAAYELVKRKASKGDPVCQLALLLDGVPVALVPDPGAISVKAKVKRRVA
jgi:hypothetical protein